MFSPRHQSLIDNLGGIVAPGIDMDAFLDDRVRASSQSLANLVSARLDLGLLLWLLAAHRGPSWMAKGPVEARMLSERAALKRQEVES